MTEMTNQLQLSMGRNFSKTGSSGNKFHKDQCDFRPPVLKNLYQLLNLTEISAGIDGVQKKNLCKGGTKCNKVVIAAQREYDSYTK